MRIELKGDTCSSSTKLCSNLGDSDLLWGEWDFSVFLQLKFNLINIQLGNKAEKYKLKNVKYLRGNLIVPHLKFPEIIEQLSNNNSFVTIDSVLPDGSNSTQANKVANRFKG